MGAVRRAAVGRATLDLPSMRPRAVVVAGAVGGAKVVIGAVVAVVVAVVESVEKRGREEEEWMR